ncbi:MAG: hypothetical protein QOC96_3175 [Acidobacteriota bacterium]|jgi:hypothetical protein|nr:hypothetical protein [Acidobacteriota bacterium]
MQRLTFVFLSLFICLTLLGNFPITQAQEKKTGEQKAQSSSWIKVAPKDAGFSVLMPSTPKEMIDSVVYGSIKVPASLYMAKMGDASFFAGRVGNFPEQLVTAGYVTGLFENAHRVFFETKGEDGKTNTLPFTKHDISLNGYSGREYVADCGPYKKNDAPCNNTIRVYKVGDNLFIVGMSGTKSILSVELTEKFFSSFTLTQ